MMLDNFGSSINIIDFPIGNGLYNDEIISNDEFIETSDDPSSSSETTLYEHNLEYTSYLNGQVSPVLSNQPPFNMTHLYDYDYLSIYHPMHQFITINTGPEPNQVKEFNILPTITVNVNYLANPSDYIVARLQSDHNESDEREKLSIFMGATCAVGEKGNRFRVRFPNMKISKTALHGRTKGYTFYIMFTLVIRGREVYSIPSNNFYIWSNVNQVGFPREERKLNIKKRKELNTNRRKGKKGSFL